MIYMFSQSLAENLIKIHIVFPKWRVLEQIDL